MTTQPQRLALACALALFTLRGCSTIVQADRPFAVFEGIPDWVDKEFRTGGENLESTFTLLGRSTRRDATNFSEDLGGAGALVDREVTSGSRAISWQAGSIERAFSTDVDATEANVLGAPGWVAKETGNSLAGMEQFLAERWYRARLAAADFGDEVTRFFGFLFRP